jgi:hypothetical protein
MRPDGRAVLERPILRVAEQAANANAIVDEAMDAGLDGSEPCVVNLKMLRAELLSVKADLERELEKVWLNCVVCGVPARYVGGSSGLENPSRRARAGSGNALARMRRKHSPHARS